MMKIPEAIKWGRGNIVVTIGSEKIKTIAGKKILLFLLWLHKEQSHGYQKMNALKEQK